MDIEYWLSDDPILSPLRGDLSHQEWQKEQEIRLKKRAELARLIEIGDRRGIARFYKKNGVWYSTKNLAMD